MSYRSIKRVLGETSLERKCRFLFGACLLLLITASFWWYGSQTEELVYQQNHNTGRLLVDQVMLSEHWENFETLASRPLVKHLADKLSRQEYTWRFLLPDSPEKQYQPRDEFERKVLNEFLAVDPAEAMQSEAPEFVPRLSEDQAEYQYYQPIRAQASCVGACHNSPPGGLGIGWSDADPALRPSVGRSTARTEGELMAVVQVTIPNGPTQRALSWNRAILLSTAIVTVFLAMVAAYVIVRYVIVKPLKHLRDVSDAISHGNTALRAEIRTGDEFEALAVAFNRMLRHLVTVQDELRQVNANLDAKVDELAQANMQLYEMNRIKSDFLATMSHELRTPLNSILGFSDVLGSIDSLNDKQKRYVTNIQKSGRMLLEMINNILDLAKIESGKTELRLTEFRIEQIIGAQCDMARPLTEKKNIDLETHIDEGLPPLRQDQARVQQILNNLLSNAIKFTPEGGRITVTARCGPADSLVLQVSDTGVGIAEEDQHAIFEKFRQGKTALPGGDAMTREYSGTGLGLSIVKELSKLLGGEVSVESELGKGSVFTVKLPCTLEDQPLLDSPLADRLEALTKPRPNFSQADATAAPAPSSR